MDRFAWSDGVLAAEEQLVTQQAGVRIYDGDDKTSFTHGKLQLTTHRLIWRDYKDQKCVISLALAYIIFKEEQSAGFAKSPKILLHLSAAAAYRPPGPVPSSRHAFVRLSFREGGEAEFDRFLSDTMSQKRWEQAPAGGTATGQPVKIRTGIAGIEKSLQQKHKKTSQSINQAFEDLNQLMDKAKEMVALSKNVSEKIRQKQGDITEDETIKFKSYLLSLGIADPVTRETHGSGNKYYQELARQIASMLEKPLEECGGMMTLSDVYCRVNRARGMELLSPEDLVNSCKLMEQLRLPVRLRVFESGVMVLQLLSHSEEEITKHTQIQVEQEGCLSAEELSKLVGISVILSKERLLSTERAGKVCRDETVEGLKFYPNLFLTRAAS